jgi:hypothetical protein
VAVVLGVCACSAAGASATPLVTFTARAVPIPGFPGTGNVLGGGAAIATEYTIAGTEYGGFPPPLEGIALYLPHGIVLHPEAFPTCPNPVRESQLGRQACPVGSDAGPVGDARAEVAFGAQIVPEEAVLESHYAPGGGLWTELMGNEPTVLEVVSQTRFQPAEAPYSHELVSEFPLVETFTGGQYAVIEHLASRTGSALRSGGRIVYYLRLPLTCPAGGLPFKAELHFAAVGGLTQQTVIVTHLALCRRRTASAPAEPTGLAGTALTSLPNAAPRLSAYDGYVIFSRHEADSGRWRLLAWHEGSITPLKVPERVVPFDAEAGPSRVGAPTVVFSKCRRDPTLADDWAKASGCHVYELALPDGSPKLIRGIYRAKASDTTPAIWKGELAFARLLPGQRVPTLNLWNRASGHVNRVGAGPAHCLAGFHEPCNTKPKVLAWVKEMSLGPGLLAFQWALPEAIPGFTDDYQQIRADPLHGARQDGPTQVVAVSVIGGGCNGAESGSPDVAGGRVLFYSHGSICVGLPFESFIDSYDLTTRSSSRVAADPLAVAVAQDGARTYWIRLAEGPNVQSEDGYDESCEPALSSCTLISSEDLAGELKPD